jgi:hypothetical protein
MARGTIWTEVATASGFVRRRRSSTWNAGSGIFSIARPNAISNRRARYADRLGVRLKRISIRDQTSRWGSCSTTGALSFSWRLILAPRYVLDYLAAHEVAHLIEMNHSPRFWRLLHRICPDMRRAKVWLDLNGADLHRYGLRPDEAGSPRAGRRRSMADY